MITFKSFAVAAICSMLTLTLQISALASGSEHRAAANPYDENADARAAIEHALTQAADDKKLVLLVFGANWCGDCKILDAAMSHGAASHMVSHDFKVVKINVGKFDKNVGIATKYGVPLKKGIPAIAILSGADAVTFATKAGELADARKLGDADIYAFFKKISTNVKAQVKLAAPPAAASPNAPTQTGYGH